MSFGSLIAAAAMLIEFGGSIVVVSACLRGLSTVAANRTHAGIVRARLLVAEGVIASLGYKTAATLLKTIELQTWRAILMFTAILALRTVIKRVLVWEEDRLRAERAPLIR